MPTLVDLAKGPTLELYGKIIGLPRRTRSIRGVRLPWPFSESVRAYRKRMQKFVNQS